MERFVSGREYYWTRASEIIGYVETRREPISLAKGFAAELFGTTLVVLVWLAAAASFGISKESSVALALTVGFVVAAMSWVTDFASAGHLNPSITFGMMFIGQTSILKGATFVVAQCLGGIFGAGILIGIRVDRDFKYGPGFNDTLTIPNVDSNVGQALGAEILAAVVIVLVAMTVKDQNRKDFQSLGPMAIGLAMAGCHFAFMFTTGPGLNPSRSLGPAVWSNVWTHHWVYWVGPLLGAFVAALLYLWIFQVPPPRLVEVEGLFQAAAPVAVEETSFVEVPITPAAEVETDIPSEEIHELVELTATTFVNKEESKGSATPESKTPGNTSENEREIII